MISLKSQPQEGSAVGATPSPANTAILIAALLLTGWGCGPHGGAAPTAVSRAWERQELSENDTVKSTFALPDPDTRPSTSAENVGTNPAEGKDHLRPATPIATVAGRPVSRQRVVDLLLRAHGPGLFEQLIVLDAATRAAAERGLTIAQADVDREYELALRRLVDPLLELTPPLVDPEAAERLLASVLSQRNISREEFLLGMRRNAYLRRIVESEQVFTDDKLREEYERCYGVRVRIRHIQFATAGAATRIQERLAAGEAFENLARTYSANLASGSSGGLLDPFAETDDRVPGALRVAAFSLRQGEVSKTVQVGKWFHIIKVEEVLPAEEPDYSAVRGQLERRLRARVSEPAIRELYERLFRQTPFEIHDAILRDAFEQKHPERAR